MTRLWVAITGAVLLSACQSQPPIPGNVAVGAMGLAHNAACRRERCTQPRMVAADAAPGIQGMVFPRGLDVSVGSGPRFDAAIFTTSNVASVELRTNLFSLDARKTGIGTFAAAYDLYDVPSIFMRSYVLRVIARNTRGDETEEDVPFRIR